MNHTLTKNSTVEVKCDKVQGKSLARIIVDDKFEHRFPATSRVSKHLDLMTPDQLASRMTGGTFFFVEDKLVDFRYGDYKGFVHTDDTINQFMTTLGYEVGEDKMTRHRSKDHENESIKLRKVWNNTEISVPGYAKGADFNSILSFVWNPYIKTVNANFDLVRQICTNGMIGLSNFLNTKVPVLNRWEEHLDIAARQIQIKVDRIVSERIQQMVTEHASVADCLLLEEHISNRLNTSIDLYERQTMQNLLNAVSPHAQLSHLYRESVFDNKPLAAQLPAHLSVFDVYNIATQVRTHTAPNSKSSDFALDKFANAALFDKDDSRHGTGHNDSQFVETSFENAELAFWGVAA